MSILSNTKTTRKKIQYMKWAYILLGFVLFLFFFLFLFLF